MYLTGNLISVTWWKVSIRMISSYTWWRWGTITTTQDQLLLYYSYIIKKLIHFTPQHISNPFLRSSNKIYQCTYDIVLLAPHSFTRSTITQGYHQPYKGRDVSKFCDHISQNAWCWMHFRIFWCVYVCLLIDISANFDDLVYPRIGNISC